jgi:hypothetical protein
LRLCFAAAGLFAVALGVVAVPASAQTPSSPAPAAKAVTFTAHDVATLLQATKDAETSPKIHIEVVGKDASAMPSYDSLAHYAGIDGSGSATIWMLKDIPKNNAAATALRAALELACMDTGFAGPLWKSIYDSAATADAALPASETNRYLNRLNLTAEIQKIVDSYGHPN